MAQSIFERCGGFSTVRKAVSDFYDKVFDSPSLRGCFANTDMCSRVDHVLPEVMRRAPPVVTRHDS